MFQHPQTLLEVRPPVSYERRQGLNSLDVMCVDVQGRNVLLVPRRRGSLRSRRLGLLLRYAVL